MILREVGNAGRVANNQVRSITRKELDIIDRDWDVRSGETGGWAGFPLLNLKEWVTETSHLVYTGFTQPTIFRIPPCVSRHSLSL